MTDKLSPADLEAALEQFTGTERYHRHFGGLLLTDGAKFLADQAGCYWLYDIVASVFSKLCLEEFAAVTLTVDLDKKRGVVVIEDGNDRELYRQAIPSTDFPLEKVALYLCGEVGGRREKVLLLPGEY